jgi:hypothetical protein
MPAPEGRAPASRSRPRLGNAPRPVGHRRRSLRGRLSDVTTKAGVVRASAGSAPARAPARHREVAPALTDAAVARTTKAGVRTPAKPGRTEDRGPTCGFLGPAAPLPNSRRAPGVFHRPGSPEVRGRHSRFQIDPARVLRRRFICRGAGRSWHGRAGRGRGRWSTIGHRNPEPGTAPGGRPGPGRPGASRGSRPRHPSAALPPLPVQSRHTGRLHVHIKVWRSNAHDRCTRTGGCSSRRGRWSVSPVRGTCPCRRPGEGRGPTVAGGGGDER